MRTGLLAPDCAATKKRVTKEAAGTIVRELSLRRARLARSTTSLFAPSQKLTRPDSLFGKPIGLEKLTSSLAYSYPQAGASPPCRNSVRRTVNRTSRPTGTWANFSLPVPRPSKFGSWRHFQRPDRSG